MKETVDRSYEAEAKKGGLVIKKALYGKLGGEDVKWVSLSVSIFCLHKDMTWPKELLNIIDLNW